MQSLPLEGKINRSLDQLFKWCNYWNYEVYASNSGGIDSTVVTHLAQQVFPQITVAFFNTGLEYDENVEHARSYCNLVERYPDHGYKWVVDNYGYPVVSKKVSRMIWDLRRPLGVNEATKRLHLTGYTRSGKYSPRHKLPDKWRQLLHAPFLISNKCCDKMKKEPIHKFEKETGLKPITGELADESLDREQEYLKRDGCNAFTGRPKSTPIAFWTKQDILQYILNNNLPYSRVYGDIIRTPDGLLKTTGEQRTGCVYCMFGVHLEQGGNRFQRMARTHPKLHEIGAKVFKLHEVCERIGVPYYPEMDLFEEAQ